MKKFLTSKVWRKWAIGIGLIVAVAAYNFAGSSSLVISGAFHLGFFSFCILAFGIEAHNRIRYGPEKNHRHAKSRYWATIVMGIIFVPIFAYQGWNLGQDLIGTGGRGLITRKATVQSIRSGVQGFWVMQSVRLGGLDVSGPDLWYLLRFELLREGQVYEITYGTRTRFILKAVQKDRPQH